mmetsp:Transcript_10519/g.20999  ORF Transcript_10519/g.20999 Transcript_10519/m.20999 type:complete len:260 (+) Transcript_10519:380-1159(+)
MSPLSCTRTSGSNSPSRRSGGPGSGPSTTKSWSGTGRLQTPPTSPPTSGSSKRGRRAASSSTGARASSATPCSPNPPPTWVSWIRSGAPCCEPTSSTAETSRCGRPIFGSRALQANFRKQTQTRRRSRRLEPRRQPPLVLRTRRRLAAAWAPLQSPLQRLTPPKCGSTQKSPTRNRLVTWRGTGGLAWQCLRLLPRASSPPQTGTWRPQATTRWGLRGRPSAWATTTPRLCLGKPTTASWRAFGRAIFSWGRSSEGRAP